MTQSKEVYWKARALAAERQLELEEKESAPSNVTAGDLRALHGELKGAQVMVFGATTSEARSRVFDCLGGVIKWLMAAEQACGSEETIVSKPPDIAFASHTDESEAVDVLSGQREHENERLVEVAQRLISRELELNAARTILQYAGYDVVGHPLRHITTKLLSDLHTGRQQIEFLSRPPKMKVEALPVGAVFVHEGEMLEVKRDPQAFETMTVCYRWTRDDRPFNVDRKEMVTPLGRVVFEDRRKTIKLGVLELAQNTVVEDRSDKALPAHGTTIDTDANTHPRDSD